MTPIRVVALEPRTARKVGAFAEAIRRVETEFGFRLEPAADGLYVGGDEAPIGQFVLVRVPDGDLAIGVRMPSENGVKEPADGPRPLARGVCLVPACGCDGGPHA